jgi:hypothetical protein
MVPPGVVETSRRADAPPPKVQYLRRNRVSFHSSSELGCTWYAGLTQAELGRLAGVSEGTVYESSTAA